MNGKHVKSCASWAFWIAICILFMAPWIYTEKTRIEGQRRRQKRVIEFIVSRYIEDNDVLGRDRILELQEELNATPAFPEIKIMRMDDLAVIDFEADEVLLLGFVDEQGSVHILQPIFPELSNKPQRDDRGQRLQELYEQEDELIESVEDQS